jgi:glucose-6-phosphate 1-dehydrogenase
MTSTQENPLLEGLSCGGRRTRASFVIFGASGDLTQRKLIPRSTRSPTGACCREVRGRRRRAHEETDDEFRDAMEAAVKEHARDPFRRPTSGPSCRGGMHYLETDFVDEEGHGQGGPRRMRELELQRGTTGNRLFTSPYRRQRSTCSYATSAKRDGRLAGLVAAVIETPFGHDLDSARKLTNLLQRNFTDDEIFRIDHYLGQGDRPEHARRCGSRTASSSRSGTGQFIDHVQITVAEIDRDRGARRLLRARRARSATSSRTISCSWLALTAMEPPIDFTAEQVRNEKVKALRSLHTPGPKSVVRGTVRTRLRRGRGSSGYREEDGVDPNSMTETYVAAKLYVDNWRWADTPFYVRMGKRLARRETTIAIHFKRAPHPPFEESATEGLRPNVLVITCSRTRRVARDRREGPGAGMTIRNVHMDFLYGGAFRTGLPEAYERLILDAMLGDSTLFTRTDEVEEQWSLVDAIVAGVARDKPAFPNYAAGTWGPARRTS